MYQKIGSALYDKTHRVFGKVIGYASSVGTGERLYRIKADNGQEFLVDPFYTAHIGNEPWNDFEGWTEEEGRKYFFGKAAEPDNGKADPPKGAEQNTNKMPFEFKARAEMKGFDPDIAWTWHRKAKERDYKLTLREYMLDILNEMHRRGWEKPANLDYESHPVENYDDRIISLTDGWSEFIVNYGAIEGIYLDWCWREWDDQRTEYIKKKLPCFKTLATDIIAAEQMGLLAGRLTWLSREIYG